MKKILLWLLPVSCFIFLLSFYFISQRNNPSFQKNFLEKEDGILQEQMQEFNMTKDPALGYVPKFRLYQAINDAMTARLNSPNSVSQVQLLSWTERGSYKDTVGPSNGNGRPGTPVPVTSGRMRAVWVDLADATNKTVWVGGVDGGLWKTTDITASPATWTVINDFFGNLAIGSICQDPSNHNIMYFGTGEKAFNIDAVQGGGVWKSTDHGATWNLLANTTGFWNVSKILCDNSGNIYVGTIGSGSGLQRSTDGGTSWTNITPTINAGGGGNITTTRVADMAYDATSNKLHVVMGYLPGSSPTIYQGICYTTNPATVTPTTWTAPSTTFITTPNSLDNCAIACKDDTVYATPANTSDMVPTIYKSTNGGADWSATGSTPLNSTTNSNAYVNGQGWYCLGLGIDPNNANNVIVGSLNCYKTTNGGTTWSQVSAWVSGLAVSVYIHADQHFAQWNGNQVLVGSDGGIFYSSDGGTNFSDRNVNLRLKQFYSCAIHPSSTNYFLAGAQDNGVHQFNGSGIASSVEVTGGDGAFVNISQRNPSIQFGSYVFNQYRRSTDGGTTWTSVNLSSSTGLFINPYDYDDSADVVYCSNGNDSHIRRWTNASSASTTGTLNLGTPLGTSTTALTSFKVSPYTFDRLFFGTDSGQVCKLENASTGNQGGVNSNTTLIGSSSFPKNSTVSCVNTGTNDNNLIVTFSNYGVAHVWITSNGGTSWTNVSGDLPDIPVRWAIFFPGSNSKAILATEMGIYETTGFSGGSTVWTQNSSFPTVRTDMLKYRSSDRTLLAATHGRGLWTTTIPNPLPVTLLNFSGQAGNNAILLNWSTSSELNSSYFEIQKSNDGSNFYSIGKTNAAGTSNFLHNYNFTDRQVSEMNYYRLKMVDIDDKFIYSKTILIKEPGAKQNVWVLNNPFQSSIRLRLAKQPKEKINIELINSAGIRLYHAEFSNSPEFSIDLSGIFLSTGVYFLRAGVDGEIFVRKLIKN